MTKKTILIVDDTYENLYLLRVILEEAGFNIVEAGDGKEGLNRLYENSNVDLIISDILMPVMDGYLFCQACKKENLFKKIPFVFYTSNYTEKLDEDFALKLGAAQFLRKPIEHDELLSTVNDILKTVRTKPKYNKKVRISEDEVLKLYSERLVNKLEQKSLDLGREIVERKRAEQLLINKNEILDLIALNTPLNKVFEQLLLNYESVHPNYFGAISLVDEEGKLLLLASAPSLPKSYNLAIAELVIENNSGSCPTAAFTKKPVIVKDISIDKLWVKHRDVALSHDLKSCWSIPILSKSNAILGTFAIYSKSISTPTLDEVQELNFAVSLANIAIERYRILAEIKKKDESYKSLIDQASDSIVSYSLDGTIYDFNKAAYQNLGYTEKEFLKLKIQDFNIGDIVQDPNNLKKIRNGEAVISSRLFKCKDKSIIDVEISSKLRKDGRIVAIARDITERKKAEEKLKENEYYLRQSQIVGNIGSYNIDLLAMTWEGSLVLHTILGVNQSYEKTVKNWNDRVHIDEREAIQNHFEYCIESNTRFNKEYRLIKLDTKEEIWVHGIGELIFNSQGTPVRMIGTMQDITNRKHSEIKLLESEYNLRQSQVVGNIGSYVIDISTMTWEGSVVLFNIFGIDQNDQSYLKTMDSWEERMHPDDREGVLGYFEYCVVNNKKFNKEYRVLKLKSNEEIWVHGIGELLFDAKGNSIKMIGTIQDITDRKRSEIKLLESEYSLRQSQVVAGIGSYVVDLKTGNWESSTVLDKIYGINETYVKTSKSWSDLICPSQKEKTENHYEYCVLNRKKINIEYKILKADTKAEVWVHANGELLFDDHANPVKIIGTTQDITERKNAEVKLQESEYNLRQSQAVASIGSYTVDLNTMTWEGSMVLYGIFGIDESYEKSVESWGDLIHPDEREEMLGYLANGVKSKFRFNKAYRVLKFNTKEEIWVHGVGELIYDAEGNAIKLIGTMQDVTKRKQSEIKLQQSEKSLLIAQEIAKIGSFNLNVKELLGETSVTFNQIIGVDSDTDVDFDLWKTIVHPDDRALIKKNVFASLELNQKFDLEYRIISKIDKQLKWIHGLGEVVYVDGIAVSFFGTIQDITERKSIALDLKVANEFSSGLLQSMSEGLIAINLESEIISVNPSFCKMTGFTEEELIGVKRPYPFLPPELKEANSRRYKLLIEGKNEKSYENTYMRKNGIRFPVHILISSTYDENGVKTANFATVQDITERKKAEIDLNLAKEFNDKLVMSMQEGLIILDTSGRIVKVNDSLCAILGYSEEELIGLNIPYPFAKEEDYDAMSKIDAKIAKGEAPSFQFEFIRKNGETFLASFLSGSIKDDKGEIIALFGTMKDVSEEERAKTVLQNNAKKSLERKNVIIELAGLVGTDYKEALNEITALSAKTLNVERGSILKFNKDNTEMFCEKLYTKNSDDYQSGQVYSKINNDQFFDALSNNKIVAASDAVNHELSKGFVEDYLKPLNIKSKLSIPIQGIDEVYGILCFEEVGAIHVWTTDEEEFATSIANLVSLMIQSSERKLAEKASIVANNQLTLANSELNTLRKQLEQENVYLRNELDLVFNYEEMVYGSVEFSNVLTEVEKVAPTTATVLLLGESGTGKELLARAVHNTSLRNKKPLIKVNCSAIPRELIESELFGHKKGSFTGAVNDKIGKFELADGGTLFLDEIGELPLDMQPKILRFLQEGEIEVVGGTQLKKLDVRVIAATNRNLKEEIEKKQFREDLYFRLNVFPIVVPPLRERKDDIPLLVEHFVNKFNKAYGKTLKYISDDTMNKLKGYNWPGNIRELENLVERASILSNKDMLVIPGFESSAQKATPINKKDLSLDAVQRNHIIQVLEQCNWKVSGSKGAAVVLDLKPSTLRDRMTKLGISKT